MFSLDATRYVYHMLVILLYEIKLNRFFNPSFSFINNIEVNCFNAIAGGDLGELGYSGMVVSFFTTRGKKDRTYPWRCVTQIFRNG
jgi:hypothetical protein